MLENYFNITVTLEWISFLAAVALLNKRTGKWRLFIPWLFLVLVVETIGWYQSNILNATDNSALFSISMIISNAFFLWLLARAKEINTSKNLLLSISICFLLFALLNLFFGQGLKEYNSYTEIAADVIVASTCLYLIYTITKEEHEQRSLFQQEYFWLATGLLFSAVGSALLYIFLDELLQFRKETKINVYGYINYTTNFLLYACMIIAFVFRKKISSSKK